MKFSQKENYEILSNAPLTYFMVDCSKFPRDFTWWAEAKIIDQETSVPQHM